MCFQKHSTYFILNRKFVSKKSAWTAKFNIAVYILCDYSLIQMTFNILKPLLLPQHY